MNAQNYKPHIFSLCALCVSGNAVITLPFFKVGNPFLSLFTIAIITVVFMWLVSVIVKCSLKVKAVFYIAALPISVFAIYGTATAIYDYLRFVSEIQMPQTSIVLLSLALLITVTVFSVSSNSAIYKYGLLVAVISAAAVILIFAGGIKHFDMSQIKTFLNKEIFWDNTPKIFLRYFSSLAVPVMFVALTKKFSGTKAGIWGAVAGFLTVALCLAQSIFTLGTASNIAYPYIKAVSVISSGSLFSRLDGLVYFIFFATVITKAAVYVKTVILIIKTIFCKKRTEDR